MKQCALLVGNNEYLRKPLQNAMGDAMTVGAKLGELGFATTILQNATYFTLDEQLNEFGQKLKDHDVGLFFFAGHGVQIDGVNYLTGVDSKFDNAVNLKHSALSLNKVIEVMEKSGVRTSIVILDACRNNAYDAQFRGELSGFAPVYAPRGMLIAFATSPGQTALDGTGAQGAYTQALLSHIAQPDMPIETMFKRVRNTLSSITGGRQISWEHTSLMGDYFFNASAIDPAVPTKTGYTAAAIADADYVPEGPLAEAISGLESRNWFQQNPAMAKLTPALLATAAKDALFVLGRNIYQAACGTANSASGYLKQLKPELLKLSDGARFHLLNGMLYEIYFDSRGRKRKRAKAGYLDEIFALETDEQFQPSFDFIRSALEPYKGDLFYLPASKEEVVLDAVVMKTEHGPTLGKVDYQGENVLYNDVGDAYFNPVSLFYPSAETSLQVKRGLSEAAVVPLRRLRVNFVGEPLEGDKLVAPSRPNLQRISQRAN